MGMTEDIAKQIIDTAEIKFPVLHVTQNAEQNSRKNRARFIEGADFGYQLRNEELAEYDKTVVELRKEIEDHINKLSELMKLIERYRKIETEDNECGNHVYNEIMEHLAKYNS